MRSPSYLTMLTALAARFAFAQAVEPVKPLPYTRFVLSNGLTVILNEDHASPIVAFDLYYRFGSRDATPGRVNVAHLCEHVQGEGSPNLKEPQAVLFRSLGGVSLHAAATTEDITHYYFSLPANQLETALWVEADRMANPLTRMDSAQLAATKAVVAQERLVNIENPPLGVVRDVIYTAVFPKSSPYSISGASPLADLAKMTAADIRDACLPYYVPNNAVLGVSGNFDTPTVKRWVQKYFGPIPRGADPKRAPVPPFKIDGEKRLVLEDYRINVPQLRIQWAGAPYDDPDRMALIALATVLSPSRWSADGHLATIGVVPPASLGRLSKLLVVDRQLATSVIVDNSDVQHAGIFEVAVFPRPNASLTVIETLVDSVLASLATNPVTKEEIATFNSYNRVYLPTTLQPHFMRADTLAHDEIFAGDPGAYAKQANAAQKLTPADIDRVVKRFLVPGRSVEMVIPAGKLDLISKPNLPYTNVTPPFALKRP